MPSFFSRIHGTLMKTIKPQIKPERIPKNRNNTDLSNYNIIKLKIQQNFNKKDPSFLEIRKKLLKRFWIKGKKQK